DDISDPAWFEGVLRQAEADPQDMTRFTDERIGYIEDLLAELDWVSRSEDADEDARFAGALSDEADMLVPARNPFRAVGRNDPCPCGSGKKFKRCCLVVEPLR